MSAEVQEKITYTSGALKKSFRCSKMGLDEDKEPSSMGCVSRK